VTKLQHIRLKNTITVTNKQAQQILSNKVSGHEWRVISAVDKVEDPPEVKRVSISEKTQEVNQEKSTNNNANRKRSIK
jgi:hypothetical protein